MTVQDQGTDLVRQGQAMWTNAADSWTQTMQRMFAQSPGGAVGVFDLNRAMDSWFDLAQTMLAVNREYARNIARAASTIASTISEQAEQVGSATRDHAEAAMEVVREETDRAERAQREQTERAQRGRARGNGAQSHRAESDFREETAERYSDMTKAQLQEQLAEHDLPKSGTVEELRERLIENVAR